jgi:DNA-binding transcriptional LysR family regulator
MTLGTLAAMNVPLLRHPLHKADLKLLACLDALFAERQVSKAARALGMDQPSMSAALARLRELFDDPLFTRVGQGMAPTPRALALAGPVHLLLEQARALLVQAERELGGRVEGSFDVMIGADFIATRVLPVLAAALEQHMPSFHVNVLPPKSRDVLQQYAEGSVDLGIGYLPKPPPTLYRQLLFREPWHVICRRRHPLFRDGLDLERFAHVVQVQVSPTGSGSYARLVDTALAACGLQRRFGMTVPLFEAAGPVVAASHLVAVVPATVARAAAERHAVDVHEPPLEVPAVEISLYWHESTRHSALHQRVRRHLLEHFAGTLAGPPADAALG